MTANLNVTRSAGFRRYLTTNSAATSFNANLAGGRLLPKSVITTQGFTVFPLGKSLVTQIMFFGVGASNTTFDYRIWLLYPLAGPTGVMDAGFVAQIYGVGGCVIAANTADTLMGQSTWGSMTNTDVIVDGLTFTLSTAATTIRGPGSALETALLEGNGGAYSPANDTAGAVLVIPNLGRATGMIIDFDMTGATSGNALIMSDDV